MVRDPILAGPDLGWNSFRSREVEDSVGSSGLESEKRKEEGSEAPPTVGKREEGPEAPPTASYLHFCALPFDLYCLLRESIDFKGDEFSVADSFPRVKGDWDLQCLPWLYHIHVEVYLDVWGVGVQTI